MNQVTSIINISITINIKQIEKGIKFFDLIVRDIVFFLISSISEAMIFSLIKSALNFEKYA